MTKTKEPNASVLFLKIQGYSDWAGKVGYTRAKDGTLPLLASIGQQAAAWGGRLVAFEGDAAYVLFGPGPAAGVPAAVRAGQATLQALPKMLRGIEKAVPGAAVHAFSLSPAGKAPKASLAAAWAREAVRAASRHLANAKPGPAVLLAPEAAAAAGGAVSARPAAKGGPLAAVVKVSGAKPAPQGAPAPASPEEIAESRLRPLRAEEKVAFSILAFRASRTDPNAPPAAASALKDAFREAGETGTAFGGGLLAEPRDGVSVLFTDRGPGEDAARAALLAAFSALGRLATPGSPFLWGAGVASGTASFEHLARRGGDAFRKALGEARTMAQPRRGGRIPLADEATRSRCEGAFESRLPLGGARGTGRAEVPDADPGAFLLERLGTKRLPPACLGASGKEIQGVFKDAEKEGALLVAEVRGETESSRALGTLFLLEEARRHGWKVLHADGRAPLALDPLSPWKAIASRAAGILPGTPAEASEALLGRALDLLGARAEEFLPRVLVRLLHGPGETAVPPSSDAELRRRLAEKGVLLLLSAAAGKEPTLILLQDLHLGDPSSVAFIVRAKEFLRGRPGILACVHDGTVEVPGLDYSFPVPPPRAAEGLALAREILGGGEPGKDVRDLAGRLAFEPARLAEAFAFLAEKGRLRQVTGRWALAGPEKPADLALRALAQKRLAALPPELRKAAGTAAALGPVFTEASFRTAWPRDPLRTLRALEKERWLIPGPSALRGEWGFRAAEFHAVAEAALAPRDRAAVHARAAEALGSVGPGTPLEVLARIAWHLRGAGNRPGLAAALRLQGTRTMDLGFPAEAEACYREAEGLPCAGDLEKAEFLCRRAEAQIALGAPDAALAGLAAALKLKPLASAKKRRPAPAREAKKEEPGPAPAAEP
jgi:hypothetical protein